MDIKKYNTFKLLRPSSAEDKPGEHGFCERTHRNKQGVCTGKMSAAVIIYHKTNHAGCSIEHGNNTAKKYTIHIF
jgi:hypothetical protein